MSEKWAIKTDGLEIDAQAGVIRVFDHVRPTEGEGAMGDIETPKECESAPALRWNIKGIAGPLYITKVEGKRDGGPRVVLSQPGGFELEIALVNGALRLQKAAV